jgi:ABC-type phosphate transport system substrate-binding protein
MSGHPASSSRPRPAAPKRPLLPLLRIIVYLLVIAAIWYLRGDLRDVFHGDDRPDRLVIAGLDVAPPLTRDLVDWFERTYPDVESVPRGGGSVAALEDLVNGRCDVAFTARPPTPREAELFRAHGADSVLAFPVATGALVLWAGSGFPEDGVSANDLTEFLAGRAAPFLRMYVPDPNLAWWDVLLDRLDVAPPGREEAADRVVFLQDTAAVLEAVARDPESIGLTSDWAPAPPDDVHPLAFLGGADGDTVATRPTHETVAGGTYPLYHHLYVCCSESNRRHASVFVTLVTSGPGQRYVERAGFVPARWTAREVLLTREGSEG